MNQERVTPGSSARKKPRRRRLCGTCKWGGVTLCVLLFALWLGSGWWTLAFNRHSAGETDMILYVNYGGLSLTRSYSPFTPTFFGLAEGITFDHHDLRWGWRVSGRWDSPNDWTVRIPFWLPFLLIALPTGWLFWSDYCRRGRVGCCERCGYDLKGNTTGRCPECRRSSVNVNEEV